MALNPQMADLSVAHRLRIARDAAGLTQRELAQAIGMSRDRVSDYENGATLPSDALASICEVLRVSADWLLFGATRVNLHAVRSGSPDPSPEQGEFPRGRMQRGLISPVRSSPEDRVAVAFEGLKDVIVRHSGDEHVPRIRRDMG